MNLVPILASAMILSGILPLFSIELTPKLVMKNSTRLSISPHGLLSYQEVPLSPFLPPSVPNVDTHHMPTQDCTLSPRHRKLQVANFQRHLQRQVLPSISYCRQSFSSTVSHLLQSVTPLPVHQPPAPVRQLLYCTRVLLNVLYSKIKMFCVSLCIIYASIINLLQYSTVQLILVVGSLG